MFNWWRSLGFMDDMDMPMKRWWFKVTLEIEEDDKHPEPTIEWLKEKINHMVMPLIDKGEIEVETKDNKETLKFWDWEITRPVIEEVAIEEVLSEVDLIPVEV